jgi:hypothetical protein
MLVRDNTSKPSKPRRFTIARPHSARIHAVDTPLNLLLICTTHGRLAHRLQSRCCAKVLLGSDVDCVYRQARLRVDVLIFWLPLRLMPGSVGVAIVRPAPPLYS